MGQCWAGRESVSRLGLAQELRGCQEGSGTTRNVTWIWSDVQDWSCAQCEVNVAAECENIEIGGKERQAVRNCTSVKFVCWTDYTMYVSRSLSGWQLSDKKSRLQTAREGMDQWLGFNTCKYKNRSWHWFNWFGSSRNMQDFQLNTFQADLMFYFFDTLMELSPGGFLSTFDNFLKLNGGVGTVFRVFCCKCSYAIFTSQTLIQNCLWEPECS